MRPAICVPVLGLWAAFALAQAPEYKDVDRAAPSGAAALAPGIPPIEGLRPVVVPPLRSSLAEMRPEPRAGANRNVIERAIRALGSRFFPGKGFTQADRESRTGFSLIDRQFAAPPRTRFSPAAR